MSRLDIRLARADDRQDLIDLLWRASLAWDVVRQDLLDNPDLIDVDPEMIARNQVFAVGPREDADRRKDRLLRATGWEVVRVRTGRLLPLGPHDVVAAGVSSRLYPRILDALRDIRGPLFVDAYLR